MPSTFTDYAPGGSASATGSIGASNGRAAYWPLSKCRKAYLDYLGNKQDEINEQKDARRYYQARDEHGIDVEDLQRRADQASDVSGLTRALTAALTGQSSDTVSLTASDGSEITLATVVGAVAELAQLSRVQDTEVTKLRTKRAEDEVDAMIGTGRIFPKAREDMVALSMEDHDRFLRLLPDEPYIQLNAVAGSGGTPQGEQKQITDIDADIARLTGAAHTSRFFSSNGTTKK